MVLTPEPENEFKACPTYTAHVTTADMSKIATAEGSRRDLKESQNMSENW